MEEEKKDVPKGPLGLICVVCGEGGGKFRYIGDGRYVHTPRCAPAEKPRDISGFKAFETTNLSTDGSPVRVESLRQLRKMENQCGVGSVAYNMDAQNFDR